MIRLPTTGALCIAASLIAINGCAELPANEATGFAGEMEFAVNALVLPDATDVLYDLSVSDSSSASVWSETSISSNLFGAIDGSGSFSYVGPCDADDAGSHTATLTITELTGLTTDEWVNPGALTKTFACTEDTTAVVDFDVLVAIDGNQGFADVTVDFGDVFCSAAVECENGSGADLVLVQDAAGTRLPSALVQLTCTAGSDATFSTDTSLYMNDIVVDCGNATTATLDPTALGHTTVTPTTDHPVEAYIVNQDELDLSGVGDALTWTIAIGLDDDGSPPANCSLTTRMTASEDTLTALTTPTNTTYPVIDVDVELTDAGGNYTCSQHPIEGGNGVGVVHTPDNAAETFQYEYAGTPTVLYVAYDSVNQLTGILSHGGQTGIAGADAFCVTQHGAGYKAMISDGTTRDATSLTDWVFLANTQYIRLEDDAVIGTTNGSAVFDFPIDNRWSLLGGNIWTGMASDWSNDDSNDCQNWTSQDSGQTGIIASTEVFTSAAVSNGTGTCNGTKKLICVQQP